MTIRGMAFMFLISMVVTVFVLVSPSLVVGMQSEPEVVQVLVQRGDSVWSLAERHGRPGVDIRSSIYAIKDLNDLDSFVVFPGQTLQIPLR